MRFFVSWSKKLGMEYAVEIKRLLEGTIPAAKAFVSEMDIVGGEDVQSKIIESINQCDILVICFTKETKRSPWLLFEAGYARGCGKRVIPFLFDDDPEWHSWIDNPMNIAREIKFSSENLPEDILGAFTISPTSENKNKVEQFRQNIYKIKGDNRRVDVECEDLIDRLTSNKLFFLENPYYRDRTAYFLTGFESFELYRIITEFFLYTGKYLWIYGRKNMKLVSGNFNSFFRYLDEKTYDKTANPDGIDFRCLFLDPESEEVQRAHIQQDIFSSELKTSIIRARTIVGDNESLKRCFRLYSNKRDEVIIRLDNSILYSRPAFDVNGRPQLMTNTGFEVFSAKSGRGKACIEKFEAVWNNAKELI